ncbi:MAG TPA: ABC transporter ATP-binding protein [Solirubrobacteraceae bacterium]|nr:ABC transporter ATP-binding protein [Solirubrobacteraceae bacterium]
MTDLVVTGLNKSFGSQAVLEGVDLTVPAGSLTAILGPSGSGKTTLLRIIAGFEPADSGTVALGDTIVDGDDHERVPSERRNIGYVPQEGSLFPHLTVARNIGFGLPRRSRDGERVDELLEMIGMSGLGRRYPHQLSGGQQQRVALARALAGRPSLILLDEPFSGLDASLRTAVRADVNALLHQAGTTGLLVTHDQDEALSMADHVAVIRRGRICQRDTPQGMYANPADAELARFVGEANLIAGVFAPTWVKTPFGNLMLHGTSNGRAPHRPDTPAVVLIRPEQVRLQPPGSVGLGLPGRVLDYRYHGHEAMIRLAPDVGGSDLVLLARASGRIEFPPGSSVSIVIQGPVVAWPADPDVAGDSPGQ